jgi:hypothetical protein
MATKSMKNANVTKSAIPAKATGKRRGRKPADPNETPEMRFKRLATIRTRRVLQFLKGLENCTTVVSEKDKDTKGKAGYYSTPQNWEKILKNIERATERVRKAIENKGPINGGDFSL